MLAASAAQKAETVVDVILAANTPAGLPWFTYLAPSELAADIVPGSLVKIPFRNKILFAIVIKKYFRTESANNFKIVNALSSLIPLLPQAIIDFALELSLTHHSSSGAIIKMLLPPLGPRGLKKILAENFSSRPRQTQFKTKPAYQSIKTPAELYAQIKLLIKTSGQHLILVPEITVLPPLALALSKNKNVFTLTSASTARDFFSVWLAARQGRNMTVIGTRRALFLPWTNLAQIIVTEEGHPSYKSFDAAPRYETADAAARLVELNGARLIYIGHTPSVSAYKKFSPVPPKFTSSLIVNMNDERRGGNYSILSHDLEENISVAAGSVFLLLNRKGSVTAVSCRDCGYIWRCPGCARSYVLYQKTGELRCEYCVLHEPFTSVCPSCRGSNLKLAGAGTELLERALAQKSWAARFTIIRIDSGIKMAQLPKSAKPLLIIGTEYAWRFINWNTISLVGVLDADTPLYIPEYLAAEQLWQRLRALGFWLNQQAKFFIQTRHPEHSALSGLSNPALFYQSELVARKMFNYPPDSLILKLFASGPEAQIKASAEIIYEELKALTAGWPLAILDKPRGAFPPYFKGLYRAIIILKVRPDLNYSERIKLVSILPSGWKVDWNPESLLSI